MKIAVEVVNTSISEFNRKAFIECCRQELTSCVGPMAMLIMDELSSDVELVNSNDFLNKIEAQIPDSKLANEFKTNVMLAWERENL
jgi:hypothetical protein